jgi:hypothetical protein
MSVPTVADTAGIVCLALLALLTACGGPAPPPLETKSADVRGVVVSLTQGGAAGEAGTLRIEGGRQADTRYAKAVVTLTAATRIYQRVPSGRSPVPFESLRLGDKVEVRFTGRRIESEPAQGTAGEVLILLHLAPPPQPVAVAPPVETYPSEFTGTQGPSDKQPPDRLALTLRAVRLGPQEHFDRAVFEFDADTTPGYHIDYIPHPQHCGSGLPAEIPGTAWLQVQLHPAQAHTGQGGSSVGTLRKRGTGTKVLLEAQEVCDFEHEVIWVLGLAGRRGYRVLELPNPPRIVVDVAK